MNSNNLMELPVGYRVEKRADGDFDFFSDRSLVIRHKRNDDDIRQIVWDAKHRKDLQIQDRLFDLICFCGSVEKFDAVVEIFKQKL